MSGLQGVRVGDKIVLVGYYNAGIEVIETEVVRIGRTLLYITLFGSREVGIYIETGREKSDFSPRQAYTVDGWVLHRRRTDLLERLRTQFGISFRRVNGAKPLSIDAIQRILDVVESEW